MKNQIEKTENEDDKKAFDLSPNLCRAARALLGWTREDLADHSNISISAIQGFENETRGARGTLPATVSMMRLALEKGGVIFDDDGGVRMKKAGKK